MGNVHESYRVEKIVVQHLTFLLSRLVSVYYWFQMQFYHNCKKNIYMAKRCGKCMWTQLTFCCSLYMVSILRKIRTSSPEELNLIKVSCYGEMSILIENFRNSSKHIKPV